MTSLGLPDSRTVGPGVRPHYPAGRPADRPTAVIDVRAYNFWYGPTRALANEPEVLLMDEPTSALDPIATERIEELVVELKRRYTIVIVTHNMQQAARIADFTGFFYLGRLVEFGDTAQVFTRPRDERTEAYITGRFG